MVIKKGLMMNKERKEGVVITSVVATVALIVAFATSWERCVRDAMVSIGGGYKETCEFDFTYAHIVIDISGFYEWLYYKDLLMVLLPIFIYGVLRSLGVLRRLFGFEKVIGRIVGDD